MLKPFQSFGRNRALDLRTVGKAESEKLPFLRSRDRALGLIHLECELLRDESRDAFHHSLTRALAASRSEEHTSELQSRFDLVCRLLLEKKKTYHYLRIHKAPVVMRPGSCIICITIHVHISTPHLISVKLCCGQRLLHV